MKILLIAPTAYNYYIDISETLKDMGHSVHFVPDFVPSFMNRSFRFLSLSLISFFQNRYICNVIKKLPSDFDCIFLIRGYAFNEHSIKILKDKYNDARLILYQWDPLSVSHFSSHALKYFDKCFTFDYSDSTTYSIFTQKPLFFIDKYNHQAEKCDIDISFIGSNHSNRLEVCSILFDYFKKYHINMLIRINSQFFKTMFFLIKKYNLYSAALKRKWIVFSPISRLVSQSIFDRSIAVLDIHSPKQKGLSIRVIEVLSKGKKLITTNLSIKEEKFYNPNMICIIDPYNLDFDISFFKRPNEKIDMGMYRLDNWLLDILS